MRRRARWLVALEREAGRAELSRRSRRRVVGVREKARSEGKLGWRDL